MKPNRVLGKGLSALIPVAEGLGRLGDRDVRMLPLAEIGLNPLQPRKSFNDNNLIELSESIRQVGVLQPLLVRRLRPSEKPGPALAEVSGPPAGTGAAGLAPAASTERGAAAAAALPAYCLVAGERRLRAAQMAGLGEVPCIVCTYEETEALRVALLENIQREDLNPVEEAAAYQQLLEAYGATQEELAGMLGKNRSSVANSLRLLSLEPDLLQMLRAGEISTGHAKAMLAIEDGRVRLRLARLCRTRGLSVRECERRVQGLTAGRKGGRTRRRAAASVETREVRALRERAEEHLGAPVRIEREATGRGALTIRFFSDDDLERLLGRMGVNPDLS
jgi:ParB family chromosome partitioning protein